MDENIESKSLAPREKKTESPLVVLKKLEILPQELQDRLPEIERYFISQRDTIFNRLIEITKGDPETLEEKYVIRLEPLTPRKKECLKEWIRDTENSIIYFRDHMGAVVKWGLKSPPCFEIKPSPSSRYYYTEPLYVPLKDLGLELDSTDEVKWQILNQIFENLETVELTKRKLLENNKHIKSELESEPDLFLDEKDK